MELLKAIHTDDQILHSGSSIVFGENTIDEGNAITHTAGIPVFTIGETGLCRVTSKFNYNTPNTGTTTFEPRNYATSTVVEQVIQNPQNGTIMINDVLSLMAGTSIEVYFPALAGSIDVLTVSQPVITVEKIR